MFVRDLLSRFWLADPPDARASPVARVPAMDAAPAEAGAADTNWPDSRLAVTDGLWGEGFLQPGGAEEVLVLAKPLGLSAAHSLLLVGAETGGPPLCLATDLGCWVSAHEADGDLAAIAARRCAAAGLGKRASVALWSPSRPEFPERYFHRALALDPAAASQPEAVLPAIVKAVKPGGELAMTAIVSGPAIGSACLAEWMAAEARPHPPASERTLCGLLGALGHEVRVAKDISAAHLDAAVSHWQAFVQSFGPAGLDPARARLVVREAEAWVRRARLLRDGAIRLVRFHSIGRGT